MHRYIKAVGAGTRRARALSRDEAREAMSLVASGRVESVQIGAFLAALRMKGETPEELAGFADAFAAHVPPATVRADALEVDAHGDGHGDAASILVAAACAAAAAGVPVCLALERGSAFARHGLDGSLGSIGLDGPLEPTRASRDLDRAGVAATDLSLACPPLARLVALRPLLGLRTAAQTISKLVSSFSPGSLRRVAGVFHAPYLESTAAALGLVGVERGLVVQALGGLPEARPGKIVRVADAGGVSRTIDLRAFVSDEAAAGARPSDEDDDDSKPPKLDGAPPTLRALAGRMPEAKRAAAAAAILIHAATGADPLAAAEVALAALTSGRARAIADRLR